MQKLTIIKFYNLGRNVQSR